MAILSLVLHYCLHSHPLPLMESLQLHCPAWLSVMWEIGHVPIVPDITHHHARLPSTEKWSTCNCSYIFNFYLNEFICKQLQDRADSILFSWIKYWNIFLCFLNLWLWDLYDNLENVFKHSSLDSSPAGLICDVYTMAFDKWCYCFWSGINWRVRAIASFSKF